MLPLLDAVEAVARSGLAFDFLVPLHQAELPARPGWELRALLAELKGHSLVPVAHSRARRADGPPFVPAAELAEVALDCAGEGVLLARTGSHRSRLLPVRPAGEHTCCGGGFEMELPADELALLAPPPPAAVFTSALARAPCDGEGCDATGSHFGVGAFLSSELCAALASQRAGGANESAAAQLQPVSAWLRWHHALQHRPRGSEQLIASLAAHAPDAVRAKVLNAHLRSPLDLSLLSHTCDGRPGGSAECGLRAEAAVRVALSVESAAFLSRVPLASTGARDAVLRAHRALVPPPAGAPGACDAAGVGAGEGGCAAGAEGGGAERVEGAEVAPLDRTPLLAGLRVGGPRALVHALRLRSNAELLAAARPQARGRRRKVAALHFSDGSSCACGMGCALDGSCCPPQLSAACDHRAGGGGGDAELPALPRCQNASVGLRARPADARARELTLHNEAHFPAVLYLVDEAGAELEYLTLAPSQAVTFDCAAGDALRARALSGWVLLEIPPAGAALAATGERLRVAACESL
ncbi:hypothetical protein T492DRAFT_1150793 [Pavlovales sp. CCMP2436]|nr:hypothetical protein T492DRAFT_1150793 [Pavlovales sp. CCMP2436]